MENERRPIARHYTSAPLDHFVNEPQRHGSPRPGHGTVYVKAEGGAPPYPAITYAASWIDQYDRPNERDESFGAEDFDGTRAEVLAWARSRPAAQHLLAGEHEWEPLPDDDNDVRLRGE